MAIIYTNSTVRTVSLTVPVTPASGTMDVKVYKDGTLVYEPATVTSSGGSYNFTLPFSLVNTDAQYKVNWKFDYTENSILYHYDNDTIVNVVTPYLSVAEVQDILEDTDITRAQEAEAAARHIINAHCGQSFGKYVGQVSVTGSGTGHLQLPQRLLSFSSVNANYYWSDVLAVRGNGWFLESKIFSSPPSIRADFNGWHYEPNGVITAPPMVDYAGFERNQEYVIDGVWGWESVPEPVREASKLLVNDYASGDSLYRDRFLTSMTAADWRIQFHEGAFANTGNVRANHLLSDYVLRSGWVVV